MLRVCINNCNINYDIIHFYTDADFQAIQKTLNHDF